MVTEISSALHFRTLLTSHKYMIVDFYATWCPPCKMIAPFYNQLATANSAPGKFAFVKVDVDQQREISSQYRVTAMPTFLVFKDGQKIEEIRGADPRKIKAAVDKATSDIKSEATQATQAAQPEATKVEQQSTEAKTEQKAAEEEKTVSGSYGMTGGNNWKMSLN